MHPDATPGAAAGVATTTLTRTARNTTLLTDAANEQHYEVNAAFYRLALGPRLKYSSGFWPKPDSTFEESEVAMLEMYCDRAKLEDGMKVWRARSGAPLRACVCCT